jgi:hypothetical protein
MRETGQRCIGAAAAAALAVMAVGAAELGAFASPATAAPAHGFSAFSKAYQTTIGQKTSDVSLTIKENVEGQSISITASGAFDYGDNAGHLTLNINAGSGTETLQEVLSNGQAYVELPSSDQSLLGGKPWIAVPVGGAGSSGLSGESPTSALSLLETNASGVIKVGSATIDGVTTTEYRAKVNPNKASANASPQLRKYLHQALSQFSGLHSLPIQVWIDGQDRIRQIKETVTLKPNVGSAAASAGAVHVATTVNLSNYGVPVTVTVPPPDQVSHESLSQLGAGASGGSGSTTS